jgi:hypothetical protein
MAWWRLCLRSGFEDHRLALAGLFCRGRRRWSDQRPLQAVWPKAAQRCHEAQGRREDCEGASRQCHALERAIDGGRNGHQPLAEIFHDLVEFIERRSPITLTALARNAEALRNNEGALHCGLIKLIRPCRLGNGKDGCQMREIVTDCRRSYFNYQFISKSDYVGACDFRALLLAMS